MDAAVFFESAEFADALKAHLAHLEDPDRDDGFAESWHRVTETRVLGNGEALSIIRDFENSPFSDHSVWCPTVWRLEARRYCGGQVVEKVLFAVTNGPDELPDTRAITLIPMESLGEEFNAVSVTRAHRHDLAAFFADIDPVENPPVVFWQIPWRLTTSMAGMDRSGLAAYGL